jgi:hypothetical protein
LFLQMFCNRVLLTNSDIEIFMTPDFEDATTIFQGAKIVRFAGFAALCVDHLTRHLASDSVRSAMPARCQLVQLLARNKRQLRTFADASKLGGGKDAATSFATKTASATALLKRRLNAKSASDEETDAATLRPTSSSSLALRVVVSRLPAASAWLTGTVYLALTFGLFLA